mgnify:CR=1 FL=1
MLPTELTFEKVSFVREKIQSDPGRLLELKYGSGTIGIKG